MPDIFVARSDRNLATMTSTATRRKQKHRRKEARAAAKGPVVDLVSECSDREEDGDAGGSVASGSDSKWKRRDSRSEDARSKSRGTKARKVKVVRTATMFRVFCILIVLGALLQIMLPVTIWW